MYNCNVFIIYELSSATAVAQCLKPSRAVAQQALPYYTAVARLGFKRRATAVLKSNLI